MESNPKNKSELLGQLKIDRDTPQPTNQFSLKQVILIAVVSILVSVFVNNYFLHSSAENGTALNKNNQPGNRSDLSGAQSNSSQTTPEQPAPQQKAAPESILNASGYITARRTATVSAEIMGLIKTVDVEEGMAVKQGQILATLDDTLGQVGLSLAIAQAEALAARRESSKALLGEAQRQNKRVTDNQFSSEAERSRAQTELATAGANLASANADIKVAQLEIKRQQERLADHTIRAPFSGVVTQKNAQPGEIVAPSSAGGGFTRTGICTIVDMDSLEIEVDVNESFIGRVFEGQKVAAHLDAYGDWTIPASVIAIIPTADRAKATVKVRIQIEISDPKILPDMGVKVAFLKLESIGSQQ